MDYKFEEFKDVGSRASNTPKVTFTKAGLLNFNKRFIAEYVKNDTFVVYHYDKNNNTMGIELADESKENAYKIRVASDKRYGTTSAIAFLKHHNLSFTKATSFIAKWDDKYKLLVIDLGEKQT